jgi:Leucine-rich repeat (LRR) protein
MFSGFAGNNISDIGGIGAFSHLNGLCLQDNPIKDLTAISSLRSLEYVNLIGISEDDYSVLTQLPTLQRIDCDAEQQPLIEQALNGATVEINVIQ